MLGKKKILITFSALLIGVWAFSLFLKSDYKSEPIGEKLLNVFIMPHPPIIIPEVGKMQTLKAKKTINAVSFITKQVKKAKPDTVIVITPHSTVHPSMFSVFSGKIIKGNLSKFGADNVKLTLKNDTDFIEKFESNKLPEETSLDHGSFVPIYFLQKAGYKGKFVVINYSGLNREKHVRFGKLLRKTIENSSKKFVVIASGDFSHKLSASAPYGYSPNGKIFDKKIVQEIKTGNYEALLNIDEQLLKEATQCGYKSVLIALGVLNMQPAQNKVFSYEAPFGVGYITASL